MEPSAIVEKVRRLLALAQSDNPNEAAAALAAANKIMLEHRIERAALDVKEATFDYQGIVTTKRMESWKGNLMAIIAQHTGCAVVKQGRRGDKQRSYSFVGEGTDTRAALALFEYAQREIHRLAVKFVSGGGRRIFNSFCSGAVRGFEQALQELEAMTRQTVSSTTALTVWSQCDRVNTWLSENGCKEAKDRKASVQASAYYLGMKIGREIDAGLKKLEQE